MSVQRAANVGAGLVLGFAVGGALGLAWGRATRERVPGATSTRYDEGTVTVEFDARQAALGGLSRYLTR